MSDNYTMAIQELALSGGISLGRVSRSTVYRWKREINDRLAAEKADWRVKANYKDNSLTAVPA